MLVHHYKQLDVLLLGGICLLSLPHQGYKSFDPLYTEGVDLVHDSTYLSLLPTEVSDLGNSVGDWDFGQLKVDHRPLVQSQSLLEFPLHTFPLLARSLLILDP